MQELSSLAILSNWNERGSMLSCLIEEALDEDSDGELCRGSSSSRCRLRALAPVKCQSVKTTRQASCDGSYGDSSEPICSEPCVESSDR